MKVGEIHLLKRLPVGTKVQLDGEYAVYGELYIAYNNPDVRDYIIVEGTYRLFWSKHSDTILNDYIPRSGNKYYAVDFEYKVMILELPYEKETENYLFPQLKVYEK